MIQNYSDVHTYSPVPCRIPWTPSGRMKIVFAKLIFLCKPIVVTGIPAKIHTPFYIQLVGQNFALIFTSSVSFCLWLFCWVCSTACLCSCMHMQLTVVRLAAVFTDPTVIRIMLFPILLVMKASIIIMIMTMSIVGKNCPFLSQIPLWMISWSLE